MSSPGNPLFEADAGLARCCSVIVAGWKESSCVGSERLRAEEGRIQAAYARRGGAWRYDWSNPAYVFAMHDLERRAVGTLQRSGLWPLGKKRILDVGCGTGYWLRRLIAWGA